MSSSTYYNQSNQNKNQENDDLEKLKQKQFQYQKYQQNGINTHYSSLQSKEFDTNQFENQEEALEPNSSKKIYDDDQTHLIRKGKGSNKQGFEYMESSLQQNHVSQQPLLGTQVNNAKNNPNSDYCFNQSCMKKFKPLFSKKHQCSICENYFCGSCTHLKTIQNEKTKKNQKLRNCLECDILQGKFEKNPILNANKTDYLESNSIKMKNNKIVNDAMKKAHQTERYFNNSQLSTEQIKTSKNVKFEKEADNQRYEEEEKESLEKNLIQTTKKYGLQAASQLLSDQSKKIDKQFTLRRQEEQQDQRLRENSIISRKSRASKRFMSSQFDKNEFLSQGNNSIDQNADTMFDEINPLQELMEKHYEEYLQDIRERVMREFDINTSKWGDLIADFVNQVITKVSLKTFQFQDSIDITEYVKIQLIQYHDTSKSQYVNGLVIKKSIAHNKMQKEIFNPNILLISNSLGIQKDDARFLEIVEDSKEGSHFMNQTMKKISLLKPNLIFVEKDSSYTAIEELMRSKITLVTNVKKSVMDRLARLTQTSIAPNANFIKQDFKVGNCQRFFMESLSEKSVDKNVLKINNLIHIQGCLQYLGCTIVLSGDDNNELKIVKHSLKKIIRLSRQLMLDCEYLTFLNLARIQPIQQNQNAPAQNIPEKEQTAFLHEKHMERDFLIMKEVSFSKRNTLNQIEEDEDLDDAEENKLDQNAIAVVNQSEKEVESKINMICQTPLMKTVSFYQSQQNKDESLVCKLKSLAQDSIKYCKNSKNLSFKCEQQNMNHTYQYYHKNGYVEQKIRLYKDKEQDYAIDNEIIQKKLKNFKNTSQEIYMLAHCEICKFDNFQKKQLSKSLLEISFYQFLEQFFYNTDTVLINNNNNNQNKICTHSFYLNCKIVFMLDFVRIEYQYHPTKIYQLDLVCFRDMEGIYTQVKKQEKFQEKRVEISQCSKESFLFIIKLSQELAEWIPKFEQNQKIQSEYSSQVQVILQNLKNYLKKFDNSIKDYEARSEECIKKFEADNVFSLNKIQKCIANRASDYIYILKTLYFHIFDELVLTLSPLTKDNKKGQKRESSRNSLQIIRRSTLQNQTFLHQKVTAAGNSISTVDPTKISSQQKQKAARIQSVDHHHQNYSNTEPQTSEMDFDQNNNQQYEDMIEDHQTSNNPQTTFGNSSQMQRNSMLDITTDDHQIRTLSIEKSGQDELSSNQIFLQFDEKLKKSEGIKKLLSMCPSIPNGYDLNCVKLTPSSDNPNHQNSYDVSSIICQALLSNDHLIGLKEQGYMSLESRIEKYKHQFKNSYDESIIEYEDFYVFKENQDIFNGQISQKEIETELLRQDQYNFQINFNTYKGPQINEMVMIKDKVSKSIQLDKSILSKCDTLIHIEKILQSDLDQQFYDDLNENIIKLVYGIKQQELKSQNKNETQLKQAKQEEKYQIHSLFYPKLDINVKIYFPSHFQALRKLYCGPFTHQCADLFQSQFWEDNTGGKSMSTFYKSYNDKYVMKVITKNELRNFCDFAQPYFEYMCKSFNHKCPTAMGKILGAFKIKIRNQKQYEVKQVIIMENLTLGMDPKSLSISRYDLKGSVSRRYVIINKEKPLRVRLDTNFLEDQNSKPIVMNYTMHRLMEIAIHNDVSFLCRHDKIDYSLLAYIDHDQKLIRIGIIDYIQHYGFEKIMESKFKLIIMNQGKALPTIINPEPYKQRFKHAMNNYFMPILDDKPIAEFHVLVKQQAEAKKQHKENIEKNKEID